MAGLLVAMYGGLLALATWATWSSLAPPGTVIGPASFVQSLALRIDQGIYLFSLGSVLTAGAWLLIRRDRRGTHPPDAAARPWRWRAPLLAAAVLLILAVFVTGLLAPPQRTLDFSSSDFHLAPASADGPFELYLVSKPFAVSGGDDLNALFRVAWRNNTTGAIVGWENDTSSYAKGESEPYARPQFGQGWVAAESGPFVMVVRASLCETLATPPCSNATIEVTGTVWIASPVAYLPLQIGLGVASSVAVGAAVVQSGLGSRRTTSW